MDERRPTLLLIEDDGAVAAGVAGYAREHGFDVVVAESAARAEEAIAATPIDAIVLELVLPGGPELLGKLRLDRRVGDVPVLVYTAPRVPGAEAPRDVLHKPSRPRTVLGRVDELSRTPHGRRGRACVFVVDDHEDTRDLVAEALGLAGIYAFTMGTGRDALALLRGILPDVIFTDIHMPDMSGVDLAEQVRARGLGVPVVAITGRADLRSRHAGDFAAFLVKPVEIETLVAIVRDLVERATH